MGKYTVPAIALLLIFSVIAAGCINPPTSGSSNQNQKTTVKPTVKRTLPASITSVVNESNITPLFKVGDIAAKSATANSGLAIVDYNKVTGMYGTIEIKKNSNGGGWYTDGYQLKVWKPVVEVDKGYKYSIYLTINPSDLPEYDPTIEKKIALSTPCDLVGDWSLNKGATIYKFRLDNIVVNQTGNQTLIGDWVPVQSKDKRDFVIRWRYAPNPNSANYMEKITLSSDYSRYNSIDNFGNKRTATWIGLIPSWKAELDKLKPEKQEQLGAGTDCYKWLGGNEWYNKT
jgi:hypothetical protein